MMPIKYKEINELSERDKARFWSFVARKDENSCWNWKGVKRGGYGKFKIGTSVFAAHRISYSMKSGGINCDHARCIIMHSCDNPSCCNPNHLHLGTPLENVHDALSKGRMKRK